MTQSAKPSIKQAVARRIGVARALSKLGVASRTIAAQWVRAGRVRLNGRIVRDPESPVVLARDNLSVDGQPVRAEEKRYLMLNKPRGLVTSARDERGRDTVYSCLNKAEDQRLAPVGRLDKASEGLLLFTNDSEWASRLLDPAAHLPKLYHVQIDRHLTAQELARLRAGVEVAGHGVMGVSEVKVLREGGKTSWLEIVLHEGKNRQIRRVLDTLDIQVQRLVRVAMGPLSLGRLAKGESRPLLEHELRAIAQALREGAGQPHDN